MSPQFLYPRGSPLGKFGMILILPVSRIIFQETKKLTSPDRFTSRFYQESAPPAMSRNGINFTHEIFREKDVSAFCAFGLHGYI